MQQPQPQVVYKKVPVAAQPQVVYEPEKPMYTQAPVYVEPQPQLYEPEQPVYKPKRPQDVVRDVYNEVAKAQQPVYLMQQQPEQIVIEPSDTEINQSDLDEGTVRTNQAQMGRRVYEPMQDTVSPRMQVTRSTYQPPLFEDPVVKVEEAFER